MLCRGLMQPSKYKIPVVITVVSAAGAFSFWIGGQTVQHQDRIVRNDATHALTGGVAIQSVTFSQAADRGSVEIVLRGNGRERLALGIRNRTDQPLRLEIPAGRIFKSKRTFVILLRSRQIDLAERSTGRLVLETAALHAGGPVRDANFEICDGTVLKLDPLLDYLANHPEVSTAAAQTAVLALTDNLPVGAFAKFTPVGGEMPSVLDTSAFRVDVADMMKALLILRDIGIPSSQIALGVDPQLRIEAMIDPLAHAMAMSYYGIAPEREWEYWKWELAHGDEATRHYALFGIARFFPDVAVRMLPKWVMETRTNLVYRLSALQALAETERPEVLQLLKQLVLELPDNTELARTAKKAVQHVRLRDERRSRNSKVAVVFRTGGERM